MILSSNPNEVGYTEWIQSLKGGWVPEVIFNGDLITHVEMADEGSGAIRTYVEGSESERRNKGFEPIQTLSGHVVIRLIHDPDKATRILTSMEL